MKNEIIDSFDILDFAGGYGTSSKLLRNYFNINMDVYDPYVQTNDINYIAVNAARKYHVVFNSAMFEHITKRDDLEKLNSIVAEDGCLILHTVICERIPNDPDWFYLEPPVHCSFHTNKSMEILMRQWGYTCSIYCPTSKCWILFKKESQTLYEKINAINIELQKNYLFYKKGFVDYWKGF
jgi:2-polyprenyl-3-methyl-5-hydroxy-6-metoxy-1,4-benzoquinol methylase